MKTKKATKATKVVKATKAPAPELRYTVSAFFNGILQKAKTNDIAETLLSFAPQRPKFLKTRTIVTVTDGKRTAEKLLYLPKGKMLFRSKTYMGVFIRSLFFK